MTDEHDVKSAVLENEVRNLKEDMGRRVGSLEGDRKWFIISILGLGMKAVFDFLSKGSN